MTAWSSRCSIKCLLGILVVSSIVVVLAMAGYGYRALGSISGTTASQMAVNIQVLEAAYRLKMTSDRQIAAVRGYLLRGEQRFIEPWETGTREFDQTLAELAQLPLTPDEEEALEKIRGLQARYRAHAVKVIALARQGQTEAAREVAVEERDQARNQLVSELDSFLQAEQIDVGPLLEQLVTRRQRAIGRYLADTVRIERQTSLALALLSFLSIPLFLILVVIVWRRTVSPLRGLAAAARQLGAGERARVSHDIPDEFGEVATAFNLMIEQVEQRTQELIEVNALLASQADALRKADVLKDQFLSILSHELRTPINGIMGFGSILEDGVAGPLTPEQQAYARRIMGSAETLLMLVEDLLDMSRIQAGRFSVEPAHVSFQATVQAVLESLAPLITQQRCTVIDEVPVDLPEVAADERRVGQVLRNLISNAIKYSETRCQITLRARVEGGELLCEIADQGPGIAPEDLDRLFVPFQQLDMSVTRRAGGAGLGLAISKALIEAHGARIGVRSEPGVGSTFWFTLPLAEA
ncbi:MAG: ATP-binding protein [Candidatus Sericytochromatia bacterium]